MNKVVVVLFFILLSYNLYSYDIFWPSKDNIKKEKTIAVKSAGKVYLDILFSFYHNGISPNDFSSCPFNPTCSFFAKESLKKFGIIGILMAADRLMRDNFWSSKGDYPVVNGKLIDKPEWHYLPFYWRLNNETLSVFFNYNK